jgi:hypothetical protein
MPALQAQPTPRTLRTLQALQVLQVLRNARCFTRFVLAWFVLSLGAAIASPLVNPQAAELICTGTGVMKLLVKNADGMVDEGGTEVASRMLDCPLCASVTAPPPSAKATAETAQPLGYVLQAIPAAHIAARTAAPPPGRGPPASS